MRRWVGALVALAIGAGIAGGCGGDDAADVVVPKAEWIAPALDAVVAEVGAEPALLEIAATIEHVDVIVQDSAGQGVLYRYTDAGLTGPIEPRDDERPTFSPAEVTLDPDRIFDGILAELDDVTILDLAVRMEGAALVIDASVASSQGGILLVLLGPEGAVLGTRAA